MGGRNSVGSVRTVDIRLLILLRLNPTDRFGEAAAWTLSRPAAQGSSRHPNSTGPTLCGPLTQPCTKTVFSRKSYLPSNRLPRVAYVECVLSEVFYRRRKA